MKSEDGLELIVEHEHKGGADRTESVGAGTLEQSSGALVLHDLGEAVESALCCSVVFAMFAVSITVCMWVRRETRVR